MDDIYSWCKESELEAIAEKTMAALTEAFGDWSDICECAFDGSELQALAYRKMNSLAETFDYCCGVYSRAPEYSDIKAIALREKDKLLAKVNRHFDRMQNKAY